MYRCRAFAGALALSLFCLVLAPAGAAVVYVNKNAPGPVRDGASWATGFLTVGDGLSAASSGDEVWVAQGTYAEDVVTGQGVALYGGFAGTEASKDGRDWKANATVLQGKSVTDRIVTVQTANCVLDGFAFRKVTPSSDYPIFAIRVRDVPVTVTNCSFSGYNTSLEVVGGNATVSNCSFDGSQQAVYLLSSPAPDLAQSHATVSGCRFTDNRYAVEAFNSVAAVADCTFSGAGQTCVYALQSGSANVARCTVTGGTNGVSADWTGTATVSDCSFTGVSNAVAGAGSVTHCTFTSANTGASGCAKVSNCAFLLNSTAVAGCADVENCTISAGYTGVSVNGTTALINCTISGASYCGVYVSSGSVSVGNCIVAYNQAGIRRYSSVEGVTLSHNDVYGNFSANYVNVTDPAGQNGNISVDPLLTNPYHDVHIQPGSPCIDAGIDALVKAGSTDVDGHPRRIGAHVDIGSDESDGTAWSVPAHTWYVSTAGSDGNDGLSWARAKRSIGAALAAAQGLDEVWVARGTYLEKLGLPAGVGLYGGFAGSEVSREGRDWESNPTVIDAAAGIAVSIPYVGGTLEGFSLRGGGKGAQVGNVTANIRSCSFAGFTYGISAGNTGDTVVRDCTFSGNYIGLAGPTNATRCLFSANRYAGFVTNSGTATLSNCEITGSSDGVALEGGAYAMAKVTLDNCTLVGNATGARVANKTALTIRNSVVAYNDLGIYKSGTASTLAVYHVNAFGNRSFNYVGLTNPTGTNGNISVDPLFVDRALGIYRLRTVSPCVDAGDDAVLTAGETDLDGNPRKAGAHVDIGAYELQPAFSVALGTPTLAAPAAFAGVFYVGGQDGKLYAYTSPTPTAVLGFPVDISRAAGTAVSLNSRPAVYYGKIGKAIYLTTSQGHVVKVTPNGKVAWIQQPLGGPALSTPAVTSDGNVYVDLGFGTGSVLNFAFKLDETTGQPKYISPYLGSSPTDSTLDRSLAVDARYCYLNASTQTLGSLAVLNQDNLTVRASFAPGEEALPPFISGGELIVATKQGHLYKLNGITMSPLGSSDIGEAITAGPYVYQGWTYLGTATGRIVQVDRVTGRINVFLNSGTSSAITGLLVTSNGTLAFTTASGTLQQGPVANYGGRYVTTLAGPPAGGPVYDPSRARFLVVTTGGRVYSVPAL